MKHSVCIFAAFFPLVLVFVGYCMCDTAMRRFFAAQPAGVDLRNSGKRLLSSPFGKRFRRGRAAIFTGMLLLAGVFTFALLTTVVPALSRWHP